MIVSLLSYFSYHILEFFVGLYEFSLSVFQLSPIYELIILASVYRVTVNCFRMGRGNCIGHTC